MLRIAWAGLRVRRTRSLLLMTTVMLGVAILGGSVVYGDTAQAAFFADLARGASGIDALAQPRDATPLVRKASAGAASPWSTDDAALIATVPGVAHVDERFVTRLGLLDRRERVITNAGQVGLAMAAPRWPGFAPYVLSGRAPSATGEVVIDVPTATREGWQAGDTVTIIDASGGPHRARVTGLADFGVSSQYADTSVIVLPRSDLLTYAGKALDRPDLVIAGTPGSDVRALRDRVAALLGSRYSVMSGDQLRRQLAVDSVKYVSSFLNTLRVSAIVALAVSLLVVYNTFQIVMAQRSREHALLRVVGTRRRQLIQLVACEALIIGGVAGVGSIAVSIGAGWALLWAQEVLGGGLPNFGLVISPLALVAPPAVAVTTALVAGLMPALSASRVAPVAALHSAAETLSRKSRGGLAAIAGLALAAIVAGAAVLRSRRGHGFDGLPTMAAGSMIIFVGLTLLLPTALTALGAPLRLLARPLGAVAQIAIIDSRRHPVRFAATCAAVMAGLAPMTAFAILLTTAQVQGERELAENFPVDFVVSHAQGVSTDDFSTGLVPGLRHSRAFSVVALARTGTTSVGHECCLSIGAAEPGVLGDAISMEVRQGSMNHGLKHGTAAVSEIFAYWHHTLPGDRLTLGSPEQPWTVTVAAIYDNTPLTVDIILNWDDFINHHVVGSDLLLLRRSSTTSAGAARAALEDALVDDPLAVVSSTAERRESLAYSLRRRLMQFNVLLGFATLVAMLGIANVLSLAALERTRQTATMRALGLSRRQVYRMFTIEALLVAGLGAGLGVAFGVAFGEVLATDLIGVYGHGAVHIPIATIAGYILLAAAAAAVAAMTPALRAGRKSIIDGLNVL